MYLMAHFTYIPNEFVDLVSRVSCIHENRRLGNPVKVSWFHTLCHSLLAFTLPFSLSLRFVITSFIFIILLSSSFHRVVPWFGSPLGRYFDLIGSNWSL